MNNYTSDTHHVQQFISSSNIGINIANTAGSINLGNVFGSISSPSVTITSAVGTRKADRARAAVANLHSGAVSVSSSVVVGAINGGQVVVAGGAGHVFQQTNTFVNNVAGECCLKFDCAQ